MAGNYRYCPSCGKILQPFSDGGRLRLGCPSCGWVYYRNPTVGVAVVLLDEKRLLLGERKKGGWCIPCGHVEWDEDIREAAMREFAEETGLRIVLRGVCAVHSNFHDPEQHTVGIWWFGERSGGELIAGDDLRRVAYFPLRNLPELCYPTDRLVVSQLIAEGRG